MIKNPCFNCDKRQIYCHNDCEDYRRFKVESQLDAAKRNRSLLYRSSLLARELERKNSKKKGFKDVK